MSKKEDLFTNDDVLGKDEAIDSMVEEFRSSRPDDTEQIVEPIAAGTAEALTAVPKAKKPKPAPAKATAPAAEPPAAPTAAAPAPATESAPADTEPQRNPIIRFLCSFAPCMGDGAFEVVRKSILIFGILAFTVAITYLSDDLLIVPHNNAVMAQSLVSQYTPGVEQQLSAEEQNYNYPAGMDDSFKKLYYQNNDIRGWVSFHSTDGTTVDVEYPIMYSADNDYYLYHDFNRTYNKNGSLFFDHRNQFNSAADNNRNLIVYGHNMASGQMFATLNNLLYGVDYARTAPTFTLNTLYETGEYKVFAVMVVDPNDANPFGYLRTDFNDNVDFAGFLADILARSLYVYGDVDLRPDDDIVTFSTCNTAGNVHFSDGRTVVVARRVREGEDPSTDVSQISYNTDVLMPYAWYTAQNIEPHPYYLSNEYMIQPLDTLQEYLATSTVPNTPGATTTYLNLSQLNTTNPSMTTGITTTTLPSISTRPATTRAYLQSLIVQTPTEYTVGDSFDYANTTVTGMNSNGTRTVINPRYCAITGFNTNRAGICFVTLHYGAVRYSYFVTVKPADGSDSTTTPTPVETTTATVPQETTTLPHTDPTAVDPAVVDETP